MASGAATRLGVLGIAVAVTPMVLPVPGIVNPSSLEISSSFGLWGCGAALVFEAQTDALTRVSSHHAPVRLVLARLVRSEVADMAISRSWYVPEVDPGVVEVGWWSSLSGPGFVDAFEIGKPITPVRCSASTSQTRPQLLAPNRVDTLERSDMQGGYGFQIETPYQIFAEGRLRFQFTFGGPVRGRSTMSLAVAAELSLVTR